MSLTYGMIVCPGWPTSSDPKTAQEVEKLLSYGNSTNGSPCKWKYSGPHSGEASPIPGWSVRINNPNGWGDSSKFMKSQLKFIYCTTHDCIATNSYITSSGYQRKLRELLQKYWKQELQAVPGTTYSTLKWVRKNMTPTIRNMW